MKEMYSVALPDAGSTSIPLVLDSPHSGQNFPADSGIIAPEADVITACDAWVDELWAEAPSNGGTLLSAHFPRAYIDANRNRHEVDPDMVEGVLPFEIKQSSNLSRGMGLIWRNAQPGVPMYASKLPVAEVMHRINDCYIPYHTELKKLIDQAHGKHGQVWHIDCHSMKSVANSMNPDAGSERPDIVVSDCDGNSCAGEFTEWVAQQFRDLGYRVSINSPFHGGQIVRDFGDPENNRHSIQIEVKRTLYMNEVTTEKHAGFDKLKKDITIFTANLKQYIQHQLA